MIPALPALRDFSDRLSPMVVKEMRQGLRTRFFTLALILFHVVLGCLMLSFLAEAAAEGAQVMFWTVICVALLGVMPAQGFTALHGESQDGTLDMLRLTGITAFRIVWGKWFTLYSQALLLTGSLMPYLIARYFMGGVEIVAEAVALLVLVATSAMITAAVVAFSSQRSLWIRLLGAAAIAGPAFGVGALVLSLTTKMGGQSMMTVLLNLDAWQICLILGGVPLLLGFAAFLFISTGASRIASAAEDHGSVKRLLMLLLMTVLMVLGISLILDGGDWSYGTWCFAPMMMLSIIFGMDVTTESMPAFPCVTEEVKARYRWLGALSRLLYPGWASGIICYVIACVETFVLSVFMSAKIGSDGGVMSAVSLAWLAGVIVPVCINTKHENRFAHWWVVQAITLVATILLGMAGAMTGGALSVFGLFTPITSLVASMAMSRGDGGMLYFAGVVAFFWLLAAFVKAVSEYAVYEGLENDMVRLRSPTPAKAAAAPDPAPPAPDLPPPAADA